MINIWQQETSYHHHPAMQPNCLNTSDLWDNLIIYCIIISPWNPLDAYNISINRVTILETNMEFFKQNLLCMQENFIMSVFSIFRHIISENICSVLRFSFRHPLTLSAYNSCIRVISFWLRLTEITRMDLDKKCWNVIRIYMHVLYYLVAAFLRLAFKPKLASHGVSFWVFQSFYTNLFIQFIRLISTRTFDCNNMSTGHQLIQRTNDYCINRIFTCTPRIAG